MGFWQSVVVPKIVEELETFTYKPTIRGMFYYLASERSGKVLENTFKQYKAFIKAMSTARRNGLITIDAFADDTRGIYDIDDIFRTPAEYVNARVSWLKNASTSYFDKIPRWHKQKHYVEIWCEKAALRGLFISIVESEKLQVRVVVNKGWSSMPYKQANIKRLLKKAKEDDKDSEDKYIEKQFHVLYFGDYDPSGRRMDMNIKLDLALANKGWKGARLEKKSNRLRQGTEDYPGEMDDLIAEAEDLELFTRVALTKPQIQEYELEGLENPDPAVMEKLKRDANADAFKAENEGRLFQIEVDALQKEPRFKDLIVDSVNDENYFDEKIYDDMKKEYTAKDIKDEIRSKVVLLEDDPFPTYQPYLDELDANLKRDMEYTRRYGEEEERKERKRIKPERDSGGRSKSKNKRRDKGKV